MNHIKKLLAVLTLIIPFVVSAESSSHRDHAAHVHGHAILNLVISDDIMQLELQSPAMNFLGFEHSAKTSQEKKRVHEVKAFLQNPGLWVTPEPSAGCLVQQVDVKSEQLDHDLHHKHDHHSSKGPQHSDFDVMVTYQCKNSDRLYRLDLAGFFHQFAGVDELEVQWITDTAQSSTELSSRQTFIRFD